MKGFWIALLVPCLSCFGGGGGGSSGGGTGSARTCFGDENCPCADDFGCGAGLVCVSKRCRPSGGATAPSPRHDASTSTGGHGGSAALDAGGGGPDAGPPPSDAGAACDWQSCGGDVVGSWVVVELCSGSAGSDGQCGDGGSVGNGEEQTGLAGSITFHADGTFEYDWALSLTDRRTLSLQCFADREISTCGDYSVDWAVDDGRSCENPTCSVDSDLCTCTRACSHTQQGRGAWAPPTMPDAGLTVTSDAGTIADAGAFPSDSLHVCAKGRLMWMAWPGFSAVLWRK